MTHLNDLRKLLLLTSRSIVLLLVGIGSAPAADIEVINTQAPDDAPPTPLESLAKITVPAGFRVTLFAGEPDVRQPIAMEIDDRGRLWVVECYSYTDGYFRDNPQDRILIFTDRDNDGQFDERKVFWDQGTRLSSIRLGFGGVWLTSAPNLIFLPDRDRDDTPDSEPMVMLDGFETDRAGHNIVNGLRWGPDGWLYGRHGILATSLVGRPGANADDRTSINCAIWRFHPVQHRFEAVAHGTTNPWGMDFNEEGQIFFTNNVIGHLFHAVPGAHFERMYGSDLNPYVYDLMPMCADHYHWDTSVSWQNTREGTNSHPELGGGHSHCGGMIYLGDNWPASYRNCMFACNTHGKRVNCDRLEPHQSGYIGKHEPDFFSANDTWFRGVELLYGPDGGVYLSDWSDMGECHDHDGVHRTSGRIYKIVYGDPPAPPSNQQLAGHDRASGGPAPQLDLQALPDAALVALQSHKNEWYVRHARRVLHERATSDQLQAETRQRLLASSQQATPVQLKMLWSGYVTGSVSMGHLVDLLGRSQDPAVRIWAVRLLADQPTWPAEAISSIYHRVANEPELSVCLAWSSALPRMDVATRTAVARALVRRTDTATDRSLSLMMWYGIESLVAEDAGAASQLFQIARNTVVRRNIARRVTEQINESPAAIEQILRALPQANVEWQRDAVLGMNQALLGRRKVSPPEGWDRIGDILQASDDEEIAAATQQLAVLFGDGVALETVRHLALDSNAATDERRQALASLIAAAPQDLAPDLQRLLNDRAVEDLAAQGLVQYDHPRTAAILLGALGRLDHAARRYAMTTLTSRPAYARELLEALAAGDIGRDEITPADARQIANLGDDTVAELLDAHWGSLRTTSEDRKQRMESYRKLIESGVHRPDPARGRALFDKQCGTCHKLYGRGESIGPELTGANRSNLDFLLENIVDPSAMVATAFRTSVLELEDGRILSGVVLTETDQRLQLQTATELLNLDRDQVIDIAPTQSSLMPEGILTTLTDQEVVDLLHYLQQ